MSERRLRVGIDASNLRRGGGLTHLAELLKAADPAEAGIGRVRVWGSEASLSKIDPRPWLDLSVVPELETTALRRLYWQNRDLDRQARCHSDVLFAPGGMYLGGFRPFVTMSRNLLPFDVDERRRFGFTGTRLRYHALAWAQEMSFRRASGVIFLTEAARKVVLSQLSRSLSHTVVVHHGVSDQFRTPPRPQRPLSSYRPDAPFRWLYVSIVNYYKHPWHVAKAVAQLRSEGVPVQLDLVGPAYPPAMRRLRKTLDEIDPLATFIRYHGAIPYEELRDSYQKADGFVFASSCETFGQILVEAMQAGLPIACANRSAMPELLANAGLYFDPEQPHEIAEAMRRIMQDEQLRGDLARAAYRRAQDFSWEHCARDTFSFIRRVVATPEF